MPRTLLKEGAQAGVIVGMLARHEAADRLALLTIPVGAHVEVGPDTQHVEADVSALPKDRRDVFAVQEAIEEIEIRGLDACPAGAGVLLEPSAVGDQTWKRCDLGRTRHRPIDAGEHHRRRHDVKDVAPHYLYGTDVRVPNHDDQSRNRRAAGDQTSKILFVPATHDVLAGGRCPVTSTKKVRRG